MGLAQVTNLGTRPIDVVLGGGDVALAECCQLRNGEVGEGGGVPGQADGRRDYGLVGRQGSRRQGQDTALTSDSSPVPGSQGHPRLLEFYATNFGDTSN